MQDFQNSFGYDLLFTVEPEGLSGELALFYFDSFSVNILSSSNRLVDIEAVIEGKKVFMTFVYRDPAHDCRENVWDLLLDMSLSRKGDWFMIGDFNEIVGNHEKRGEENVLKHPFCHFVL